MTGSIFSLQAATGHKDWLKKFAFERRLDKIALADKRREAYVFPLAYHYYNAHT